MIIEIESVYGDVILHGKHINESELHSIVNDLLSLVKESEFVSAFCMRYGYEQTPYSNDLKVDFTIDLDTHRLVKPRY